MPSKKVDPVKRGDVSMAQFVYNGDVDPEPVAATPRQLKPATGAASSATPGTQMETDNADASHLTESRDKEKEGSKDKDKEKKDRDTVTIEDLGLPKSIITRLAKGVLPSNTQIQANAVLAMSKSATVFINHLANAANEHTLASNKKTIMPGDVFDALADIEFPFFRERLEAEFKKFNDTQTSKRTTYRRKVAAQKRAEKGGDASSSSTADPNASVMSTASAATDPAAPRAAKKQKPNSADDSAMDVDGEGDTTREPQDASDAETEPEEEEEDEDEDEDEDQQEDDDEEEEEEAGDNEDEVHDRLEERQKNRDDEEDEALDNDGDSD